jgi:signal transduction histidine kinase
VTDNGAGMDAETVERATEAFFTTKGPAKGTGLGLFMANRLARQSGGHLEIRSEPGQGTSVMLHLPAACAGEKALDRP